MKQEDKELIIDLLFAKYKENKDEHILDLIKEIEKTNFIVNKLILENAHIDLNPNEGIINWKDLFFDELDLSNTHLEMSKKKIKIKNVLK